MPRKPAKKAGKPGVPQFEFKPAAVMKTKHGGKPHLILPITVGGRKCRFNMPLAVDGDDDMVVLVRAEVEGRHGGADPSPEASYFDIIPGDDEDDTLSVPNLHRAMLQMALDKFDISIAGTPLEGEVIRAAETACRSWRTTALHILAAKMLLIGGVDEIHRALDVEVAREVVTS